MPLAKQVEFTRFVRLGQKHNLLVSTVVLWVIGHRNRPWWYIFFVGILCPSKWIRYLPQRRQQLYTFRWLTVSIVDVSVDKLHWRRIYSDLWETKCLGIGEVTYWGLSHVGVGWRWRTAERIAHTIEMRKQMSWKSQAYRTFGSPGYEGRKILK
jgi:hypothetical protein